jgi:hypothetical protein
LAFEDENPFAENNLDDRIAACLAPANAAGIGAADATENCEPSKIRSFRSVQGVSQI